MVEQNGGDNTATGIHQAAGDIIESISEAFCALDREWRITYVNAAAERLLRRPRNELLGHNIWRLFPDAAGTTSEREYRRAMADNVVVRFEEHYAPFDCWYEVHAYPGPGGLSIYFQDITERKHTEQSLRESEDRFRKIFEEGPLGMALICPDDRFVKVNMMFSRFLGYSQEELRGMTWKQISHPQDVTLSEDGSRRLLRGEIGSFKAENRYLHRDGSIRWGSITISLLRPDLPHRPLYRLAMVEDITERKRIEEERKYLLNSEQMARAEAEVANRRKDQFLAILSHELRTPLTPVLARLALMQRDPRLGAELRAGLEMIRRNVELEASLINDLLDTTRISRGKMHLEMEPIDAHQKIHDALEIYQNDIAAKRLGLKLELNAAEHHLRGDPARMQQIFWNLISNAVKYTPRGGMITLRTSNLAPAGRVTDDPRPDTFASQAALAAGPTLRVDIVDTGIGMETPMMERLFTPFEQAEQSLTRRFGGLGLGLAICKALVEMHGGKISARSDGVNKGSTFTVEFPTLAAAESAKQPQPEAEAQARLRILLVEDNEDTLRILSRLLRTAGHDVHTARSVRDAREAAVSEEFDLLISDIGLPDGSGWELMRQLRDGHPIRGVALSGFGTEQDVQKSREAGFAAHLVKPIDLRRLEEIIQQSHA